MSVSTRFDLNVSFLFYFQTLSTEDKSIQDTIENVIKATQPTFSKKTNKNGSTETSDDPQIIAKPSEKKIRKKKEQKQTDPNQISKVTKTSKSENSKVNCILSMFKFNFNFLVYSTNQLSLNTHTQWTVEQVG